MYGNLSRSTGWYPQRGKAYKRISYSNETTSFNTTTVITTSELPQFTKCNAGFGRLQLLLALCNQYSFYYRAIELMLPATSLAPFLCQQAWNYKIQMYKSLYLSRELTAIK